VGFIVVTGLPGSGKTTLGRAVAAELDRPLLDKDDFLEELMAGTPDPLAHRQTLSRQADLLFIEAAERHPEAILVSFWRRPELSLTSGTPTTWLTASADPVELWCRCPAPVAVGRFVARRRHPGHGDDERSGADLIEQFEALECLGPLGIGPQITVDTTGDVDVTKVALQLRASNGNETVAPQTASGHPAAPDQDPLYRYTFVYII
jgi:hypothetical protein